MMLIGLLSLWISAVTPSPGWSMPILVTDSCNSERPKAFLHLDDLDRFHLVWAGMNDRDSIGYKAFSLDGTVVFPESMMSRSGAHSVYLTTMITGDSLYAFWRESSPIYYSVRSLTESSPDPSVADVPMGQRCFLGTSSLSFSLRMRFATSVP